MKITSMGIDLAKSVLQVHGVDAQGNVGLRKQLKRKDVLSFFANLEPCLIGMEACGSAHYWARKLSEFWRAANSLTSCVIFIEQNLGPHMEQKCAVFAPSAGRVWS